MEEPILDNIGVLPPSSCSRSCLEAPWQKNAGVVDLLVVLMLLLSIMTRAPDAKPVAYGSLSELRGYFTPRIKFFFSFDSAVIILLQILTLVLITSTFSSESCAYLWISHFSGLLLIAIILICTSGAITKALRAAKWFGTLAPFLLKNLAHFPRSSDLQCIFRPPSFSS